MKKKYTIQNIDCANCALKIEDALKRVEGVQDVSLNFLTERLTVVCDEEINLDALRRNMEKTARKVESEVIIEER